ncbi:hypothetical protein VIBNIAM115_1600015 [Vibrio nigripulchritudo AM115]|nr:hypothetical protein VIBNIAM115_1600015 [Vibrio nigripulchritudo AM115]
MEWNQEYSKNLILKVGGTLTRLRIFPESADYSFLTSMQKREYYHDVSTQKLSRIITL